MYHLYFNVICNNAQRNDMYRFLTMPHLALYDYVIFISKRALYEKKIVAIIQ